jgi:hypothetical protein
VAAGGRDMRDITDLPHFNSAISGTNVVCRTPKREIRKISAGF